MRLIDADKLKQQIAAVIVKNNYDTTKANALLVLIDAQATAYDVDRVVEQLEKEREEADEYKNFSVAIAYEIAIEFIKGGGINEQIDAER